MRLSDYVEGVLSELGRNDGMVHVYVGLHSDVLGRDIAIGEVLGEADRIFPNYTALPAFGRYEGQSENSVILQLVNCCKGLKPWEEYVSGVFRLAGALGLLLGQYVVLMVVYPPVPFGAQVATGHFGAHADFMNGWNGDVLMRIAHAN